jgi:hypothetical protein
MWGHGAKSCVPQTDVDEDCLETKTCLYPKESVSSGKIIDGSKMFQDKDVMLILSVYPP